MSGLRNCWRNNQIGWHGFASSRSHAFIWWAREIFPGSFFEVSRPKGLYEKHESLCRSVWPMCYKQFPIQANRFDNGFLCYASPPFFLDGLPVHSAGYLIEHVGDPNPRTAERRFAVADFRIDHDVPAQCFSFHRFLANVIIQLYCITQPKKSYGAPWSIILTYGDINLSTCAQSSLTWSMEVWKAVRSSAVRLSSKIFSTPPAPRTQGTPTKWPPMPYSLSQ